MTEVALTRPLPVPNHLSRPFWSAAAEHVLVHARCGQCGALSYPVEDICVQCRTTTPDYTFEPVAGGGTIRSWTVIHQSFLPGFEVPFLLIDVELDAQPNLRMIGRLTDGPDTALRTGDRVRIEFDDVAEGVSVPAFALAGPS